MSNADASCLSGEQPEDLFHLSKQSTHFLPQNTFQTVWPPNPTSIYSQWQLLMDGPIGNLALYLLANPLA